MENNKRFAEEALNEPASSRQRLDRQEGTTHDGPLLQGIGPTPFGL